MFGILMTQCYNKHGPAVIKKFMLNSAEHEILNAHITKLSFFIQAQIGQECYIFFS